MSIPSSIRPMACCWYSTFIRHSYRADSPVSSWVATGMKAGVTAARRALNRPLESGKYVDVSSSSTLDLAPSLPERAHVEYKVSQRWIVRKPFPGRVYDLSHLFVVPFGDLVGDE